MAASFGPAFSNWWRVSNAGGDGLHVASLHLPTIRYGLQQLSDGKTEGVRQHLSWWRQELARGWGRGGGHGKFAAGARG